MIKIFFVTLFITAYFNVCAQKLQSFQDKISNKYGFRDSTGKEVISPKYTSVENFANGLAAVEMNKKWGLIDTKGKLITPFKYSCTDYEEVYPASNENEDVILKQGGFMNGLLRVAIGGKPDENMPGWIGGKFGFINKSGKEIIPVKYDAARNFSDGLAAVMLNGKWGFVDSTGKVVIPIKYKAVLGQFSNGRAAVIKDDIQIIIDKKGNILE